MSTKRIGRLAATISLLLLAGCPDETTPPTADGSSLEVTGDTTADAGEDTNPDSGADDGGSDSSVDSSTDTPSDIPGDKGPDGTEDSTQDTLDDAAPETTSETSDDATDGDGSDGDASCVADCAGKVCGDDGCGGTCGACGQTELCSSDQTACEETGCFVAQFTTDLTNLQAQVWGADIANIGGPAGDVMALEFYSDATGTFDLASGLNGNYATCEQCALVYSDIDPGTGGSAKTFFQTTGTLTVSAATPPASQTAALTATLQAQLVEVTIDAEFNSTPVADGDCIIIEATSFGCIPSCEGVTCGGDGCGGVCDSCPDGEVCDSASAQCIQDPCGDFTFEGCCNDDLLVWCEGGQVQSIDCADNASCGWDSGGFYNCGTEGTEDPAGTFPQQCPACTPDCDGKMCGSDGCGGTCGTCADGDVCDPWDSACKPMPTTTGCSGVTFEGCCTGEQLMYCEGDAIQIADCSQGPSCGWSTNGYYDCQTSGQPDPSGANPIECPATPTCLNKQCGDDGVGGSCGTCPGSSTCNAEGLCECSQDSDCEGAECATSATCTANVCSFSWNTGSCDDGDACTTGDTCSGGTCAGVAACDDGVACTIDSCDSSDGTCSSAPDDQACDDGNDCTADTCEAVAGCVYAPLDAQLCDDGDLCTTGDVCAGSVCGGVMTVCDDGVPCTADSCDGATGQCAYATDDAACDDGDACTTDVCDATNGCSNEALVCDDNDPCTTDSCDSGAGGCAAAPKAENDPCDDGDAATSNDVCNAAGACAGTPYTCAPGTCEVSSVPNGVDCDVVYADATTACDDGDASTSNDLCDGSGGCAGTPQPAPMGPGFGAAGETGTHSGSFFLAQQITFASDVTITGFGIDIEAISASAVMGLYSDNGSAPGNKLAESGDESLTAGTNALPALTPVAVSAGAYWLVTNYTSGGISTSVHEAAGTATTTWYATAAGSTLPMTMPAGESYTDEVFAWWVLAY